MASEDILRTLEKGAHIHFMGICGTAMASLAGLLKERGFHITGSDQNVYPPMSTFLESQNIEIKPGYVKENLVPRPDFVVVGNVISKHFDEAQALLASDIPYASLPETMGEFLIEDRHSIVVAGTHGKTTTTSMASWVSEQAGLQPGFLIGGIAKNFSKSFQNPKADTFVIEGDEYDTAFFAKVPKFTFYRPKSVILSSIEFDHADIYRDLDHVKHAFISLLQMIPEGESGLLIYNSDDPNILSILDHCKSAKISYGFESGKWQARNLRYLRKGLSFDIYCGDQLEKRDFQVPMFGKYNALNALAVYALVKERAWSVDIQKAFLDFKGIKRRQEIIGEPGGIQVIEDFAHHPTAVGQTIESFKMREGTGRLFALFEPRSNTSRRKIFQEAYAKALMPADYVLVCEPNSGTQKIESSQMFSAKELIADLDKKDSALFFEQVEEAISFVQSKAKSGDTVLIMSNGAFQGIYQKILLALDA